MHPNIRPTPNDTECIRRTAAYWRARAEEARAMAQRMGEVGGAKMLQVASICDYLAKEQDAGPRKGGSYDRIGAD